MARYVYGYQLIEDGDEIFFSFPKFPEIISSLPAREYGRLSPEDLKAFLLNALEVALQAAITMRQDLPESDNPSLTRLDGFISLPVHQAMKLELYKLFRENCPSVADFARQLGKSETLARRLLDLRHRSLSTEIENAIKLFGKELVHNWGLELSSYRDLPVRHPPTRQPR
jgi:antitoxin HicB